MPLPEDKKEQTRDRLSRDPDFRDAFLTEARNMYFKALEYDESLEDDINRFEQILGADPGSYEYKEDDMDELDIFEKILDAFDKQKLLDEKDSSTIN